VGITGCFLHIQGEISSEQLDVWILIWISGREQHWWYQFGIINIEMITKATVYMRLSREQV
jgi:hypothetical protein